MYVQYNMERTVQTSIKKIILATDFSDASREAGYHAVFLAQAYKAELKILHVLDLSRWNVSSQHYLMTGGVNLTAGGLHLTPEELDWLAESQEKTRQREKNTLTELADSFDLEVGTIFTEGDPSHEIIHVAEELNADLIVLGTHGHSGWNRFTIGSVAEFVGRHAPCAVITIRPKGK